MKHLNILTLLCLLGMAHTAAPIVLFVKISVVDIVRARDPIKLTCEPTDTITDVWNKLHAQVPVLPDSPDGLTLLLHGTTLVDRGRTLESYFARDGETLVVAGKLRIPVASVLAAAATFGCP